MRAFMSTSDDRRTREIDADQLDFASAFQWGEQAIIEARTILAETEPHGTEHVNTRLLTVRSSILAEALTAFILDNE